MSLGNLYDIIISPVTTEKTNIQLASSKYSFRVVKSAQKEDVKKAIETIFGVKVEKINIINTDGKTKKFKGTFGTRSSTKKVVISIKKGQEINFTKLEDK
jgi:large subunit ribosomal protein L23